MDLATELLVGYYMDFANFLTLVGANLGGCREFKYGLGDADDKPILHRASCGSKTTIVTSRDLVALVEPPVD